MHHIISILIFQFLLDNELIIFGIFASEVGNFSLYYVNYLIYNNKHVPVWSLLIEIFIFLLFRNIIGMFIFILAKSYLIKLIVTGFCIMGTWWGYGVTFQLIKRF
jgi:hypothetical protein